MQRNAKFPWQTLLIALLLVVVLIVIFSSYTIIDPGYRGVVVMLGATEDRTLPEGFHLVIPPMARRVVAVDVRTKKVEVNVEAASSDMQLIQVTGVLNYHLDPEKVSQLYKQVGLNFEEIIIGPAMQEAIKAATAMFRVERILVERTVIRDQIEEDLRQRLSINNIVVDAFSLADVTFSAEFDAAIERKQIAEQSAIQKQYELQAAQKDVEITLAKAEGEKKAAIIAAEGQAEARKLEAAAEATALELISKQLAQTPSLIQYEWARRLAPSVNTIMIPNNQDIILDAKSLTSGN